MLTIEEHESSNEDKGNPIKAATGNVNLRMHLVLLTMFSFHF